MSGLLSGGGALGAAVGLTEYILGTNTTTTTNNNQKSSSSNQATTTVADSSTSDVTGSTQAGADPSVIAALKSLANTAISNSQDPSKTTDLLTGILQQAGDAMTAIFGQQNQAGIYNSASATSQTNDIMSRAAADAAQAILGYQTTEQGVANTALQQLVSATATTNTNQQTVTTDTANTNVQSSASSNIVGSSSSSQQSGLSVICTWMFRHRQLDKYCYRLVSQDLMMKPSWEIKGYLATVKPLVQQLERNHFSLVSRLILATFRARTNYVCACYNAQGCKKTISGWIARAGVAIACTPAAFYFFCKTPAEELVKEVQV